MQVVDIGRKDSSGKEEWWCCWYICPNCKTGASPKWPAGHIIRDFSYCPDCGIKLNWVNDAED